MTTILLNKIRLPAIPGNLKLQPDCNSWGPYTNGASYSTGTIRTPKGKFVGYYSRYSKGDNIIIKLEV